jgi:hypothetical protein
MICFLIACSTVHYVQHVWKSSSERYLAELIWVGVPASITSVPLPGSARFAHGRAGATTAYAATETMMPKSPTPPVSVKRPRVGL